MTDVDLDELEPGRTSVDHGVTARIKRSDAYRSMFRHAQLDTPRGRALQSFSNFFLHLYPVKIPKRVLRMRYSFRLGFIAAVLFGILLVTGVYLMFVYTPSVGSAYGDMQHLKTGVGFGQLIRNMHRWAAHLMVLVVGLHFVRVFYAGAYKKPREFNWVIGVMLLLITLMFSFTGYLLPWDQLSYWAVTVGTGLVHYVPLVGDKVQNLLIGGPQVGQNTLLRFYALHVAVLPDAAGADVGGPHLAGAQGRLRGAAHERRRLFRGGDRATRRRTGGRVDGASRAGALRRSRAAARRRRPGVDHRGGAARRRHGVHVAAPAGSSRSGRARHGDGRARPRRSRSAHRSAASRTPTSRPSRPRRRGTSPDSRSCSPTSTRSSPGFSYPSGAVLIFLLLPYIDRNPDTRASHRKVAIVLFSVLLAIAVGLTVIGTFFRGPGWKFIAPWTHSYIEF